jgi:hypothetical protein
MDDADNLFQFAKPYRISRSVNVFDIEAGQAGKTSHLVDLGGAVVNS